MRIKLLFALICLLLVANSSFAQTTEFTYQGRLLDGSVAANGSYDFEFRLYAGPGGGALGTLQRPGVVVSSGIFTVKLDFGATFDGTERSLEILVKPAGSPNPFVVLSPRQPITSAPYSIRSLNSTTADTSTNSLQLGGIAANQYVVTSDPRMTDARIPLPGSADYIQNTSSQQPLSNFNVSGTGSANVFNAATQFNIAGNRVLSTPGVLNIFAGQAAGQNNTGQQNSFFGQGAGTQNTTGNFNTFVGMQAGRENLGGSQNSFFGTLAGALNTSGGSNSFFGNSAGSVNTTGNNNSFFGRGAGVATTTGNSNAFFGQSTGDGNVTGSANTLIGTNAEVSAPDLQFATAIGANAVVGCRN